jgi:alanyl-tRNA synthetase
MTGYPYTDKTKDFRIIADHLRAAVFIIADGVVPSNKERGYVLRRLIRRAALKLHALTTDILPVTLRVANTFIAQMSPAYPELEVQNSLITSTLSDEISRFSKSLDRGLKEFAKLSRIDGQSAFYLFQTFGFPWELTVELAKQKNQQVDKLEFEAEFTKHQELSRTASAGMFKGGLVEQSEITTKFHTATHLLHQALRDVLGSHVQQKGSNITSERLRFDFSHPAKLTGDQIVQIENIVNRKIADNLPVTRREMPKSEALKEGALAFFPEKYPDICSVYTIGPADSWYSQELCGGPHVSSTGQIGGIKIVKEESAGSGIRRLYAGII